MSELRIKIAGPGGAHMMDVLALGAEFADLRAEHEVALARWERVNRAGQPFIIGSLVAYAANAVASIGFGFSGEWYWTVWSIAGVSMAIGWYFLACGFYYGRRSKRLLQQMHRALQDMAEIGR